MINFRKPIIISVIILATAMLYISDQYLYSWVGFLSAKTGNCDFKQITTSTAKDGEHKKLNYPIDLARTADRLRAKENYEVTGNENNLTISRNFADLNYSISFENRETQGVSSTYYKYSINCANCESSSFPGENCTTANFQIYKKIYHIIEDLALDHRAAYELQSGLKIFRQNF